MTLEPAKEGYARSIYTGDILSSFVVEDVVAEVANV